MRRLLLALALAAAACQHESQVIHEPNEGPPPLPPASGTPIGYLLDSPAELHLRDDQLTKLHAIDDRLSTELAQLDATQRAASAPPPSDNDSAPRGRRGRGGRGAGGFGGAGGGSRGKRGGGQGAPPPSHRPAMTARSASGDDRDSDIRSALREAFEVLDADQQQTAEKLLEEHGVQGPAAAVPPAAPTQSDSGTEMPVPDQP